MDNEIFFVISSCIAMRSNRTDHVGSKQTGGRSDHWVRDAILKHHLPPSCAKYPHRTLRTLCGDPKCIAKFHTKMRRTFSQALQRSTLWQPCLFGHIPMVHRLHLQERFPNPTRSAPLTNFGTNIPQAMLCLPFCEGGVDVVGVVTSPSRRCAGCVAW